MPSPHRSPVPPSLTLTLVLLASALVPHAYAQPSSSAPTLIPPITDRVKRSNCEAPYACFEQSFPLANASTTNDANEILTAIRNILPADTKVFLVPTSNLIVVKGTADELALIQKLIAELDRPKRNFRLTYTLTEMDAGKRLGAQHFTLLASPPGLRTQLKIGSKVPVATGSTVTGSAAAQTQFTYLDIGMNFGATLTEVAGGATLRGKVEQSSIAEEKSGVGPQDPIVRQTTLEGTTLLILGKPLMLGSIDLPGTSRHLDVEVLMEPAK